MTDDIHARRVASQKDTIAIILAALDEALVSGESYAFSSDSIPIIAKSEIDGKPVRRKAPIKVFTLAVGDRDLIEAFREKRKLFQSQLAPQRAAAQNGIVLAASVPKHIITSG